MRKGTKKCGGFAYLRTLSKSGKESSARLAIPKTFATNWVFASRSERMARGLGFRILRATTRKDLSMQQFSLALRMGSLPSERSADLTHGLAS
jgi:hypothetical protein